LSRDIQSEKIRNHPSPELNVPSPALLRTLSHFEEMTGERVSVQKTIAAKAENSLLKNLPLSPSVFLSGRGGRGVRAFG